MSNMSYCRFHNTALDLQDCLDNLENGVTSDMEKAGRADVIRLAKAIVEDWGDYDFSDLDHDAARREGLIDDDEDEEVELSEDEMAYSIANACESVWWGIAYDIPDNSVSAMTLVELCLDCNRLESAGFNDEAEHFTVLADQHGLSQAYRLVAYKLNHAEYEAGGSFAI